MGEQERKTSKGCYAFNEDDLDSFVVYKPKT